MTAVKQGKIARRWALRPLWPMLLLAGSCDTHLDVVRRRPEVAPDAFSQSAFAPLSFIGNERGDGWESLEQGISDLFVTPEGRLYTHSSRRSTAKRGHISLNGKFIARLENDASNGGQALTVHAGVVFTDAYEGGPRVLRFDASSGRAIGEPLLLPPDTRVSGLAASDTEIYVADEAGERVLVHAFAASGAAAALRTFAAARPGDLALDEQQRLWIVHVRSPEQPGRVQAYDGDGAPLASLGISDVQDPRDVAVTTVAGQVRVLVAEAGSAHQVHVYVLDGGVPRRMRSHGLAGGVLGNAPVGRMEPARLLDPNAIAGDAAGNVYVNSAQQGYGSTIHVFDDAGQPVRTASALGFQFDSAVLDPEDEAVAYGHAHRFRLDWTGKSAGDFWSAVGFLRDDTRFEPLEPRHYGVPIALRRVGEARFLYLLDNGRARLGIYRLPAPDQSEVMKPVLRLDRSGRQWWRDGDDDGREAPSEVAPAGVGLSGPALFVDAEAGLWTGAADGRIWWWRVGGLDQRGIPIYPPSPHRAFAVPPPFAADAVERVVYLPEQDRLYITGYTTERPKPSGAHSTAGRLIAAYALAAGDEAPTSTWSAPIDLPGEGQAEVASAIDIVGRYAFLIHGSGRLVVRDLAARAQVVYRQNAGGAFHHSEGVRVARRGNGEYVAFVQESFAGKITVHRWHPRAPQALRVTTVASGVQLDWQPPIEAGTVRYVIYRSPQSGAGYRRVADLDAASRRWLDPEAPPDQVLHYRIAAVDAAGSDAYSFEAARPL